MKKILPPKGMHAVLSLLLVAVVILSILIFSGRTGETGVTASMAPDTSSTVESEPEEPLAKTEGRRPAFSPNDNNVVSIDPLIIQKINVRTVPVVEESLEKRIRTTGRFEMDEQGIHRVTLKVDGWVEKLYADFEGSMIEKGQPLLELYSPELVTTQEEYLLALRSLERLKDSRAISDAGHLVDAARRRLSYWDLSDSQIEELDETRQPQRTLTFYAPAGGEVMRKNVSEGQFVTAGQTLMDLVDVSRIWLIVDIYEEDLQWIARGSPVEIEVSSVPGRIFRGTVDFIYHMMNKELRSARARIVLPGRHGGPLKPGMYATATIQGVPRTATPVVPESAVIRTGQRELVLVALGEGRFRPRMVETGLTADDRVQILSGLQGGDHVVTSAQFLLDSEAQLRGVVSSTAEDVASSDTATTSMSNQ